MRFLLTTIIFAVPLLSSAETQGEVSAKNAEKVACKSCDTMKKQEEWFNKKHYLVPKQRIDAENSTEPVLAVSQRLNEESRGKRGKNFYQEFESLVGLVAAALPFDMETQGAADIAVILETNDKRAEEIYDRALANVRDKCRQEYLKVSVADRRCNIQQKRLKVPEEDRLKKCPVNQLNYEDCEAKQKSKS